MFCDGVLEALAVDAGDDPLHASILHTAMRRLRDLGVDVVNNGAPHRLASKMPPDLAAAFHMRLGLPQL